MIASLQSGGVKTPPRCRRTRLPRPWSVAGRARDDSRRAARRMRTTRRPARRAVGAHYRKQANARTQSLLERRAEPAAAFARASGQRHLTGELRYAWRTLLQNHPTTASAGAAWTRFTPERDALRARATSRGGDRERALETVANAMAPAPEGTLRVGVERRRAFVRWRCSPLTPYARGSRVRPFADSARFERPFALVPRRWLAAHHRRGGRAAAVPGDRRERRARPLMSRYEPPLGCARAVHDRAPSGCRRLGVRLDLHFEAGATRLITPLAKVRVGDDWVENEHLKVRVRGRNADRPRQTVAARDPRLPELEDSRDVGDEYNFDPPPDGVASPARRGRAHRAGRGSWPARGRSEHRGVPPSAGKPLDDGPANRAKTRSNSPSCRSARISLASGSACGRGAAGSRTRPRPAARPVPTGAEASIRLAPTPRSAVTRPARREVPADFQIEAPVSGAAPQLVDAYDETSGVSVFSEGLWSTRWQTAASRCAHGRGGPALRRRPGDTPRPRRTGFTTPGAQCPANTSSASRFAAARRPAQPSCTPRRARSSRRRESGLAGRDGARQPPRLLELTSDPRTPWS